MAATTGVGAQAGDLATVGMIVAMRNEITELMQKASDREAGMGVELTECTKAVETYRDFIKHKEEQGNVQQEKI